MVGMGLFDRLGGCDHDFPDDEYGVADYEIHIVEIDGEDTMVLEESRPLAGKCRKCGRHRLGVERSKNRKRVITNQWTIPLSEWNENTDSP